MNRNRNFATAGLALLSLAASTPALLAGEKAVLAERAASTQPVAFEVFIPVQHRAELERELEVLHNSSSPRYHKWLTPAQVNARFGVTPRELDAIKSQLAGYGLESTIVNEHHIHVTGTAGHAEQALGAALKNGTFADGKKTIATNEPMTLPSAITAVGASVVGLEGAIWMRSHVKPLTLPDNRYSTTGGYWFDDLKQAYSFPSYTSYTGKGATIATLVSGAYSPADVTKYFAHEKLATPNFSEVAVDGGSTYDATGFGSFETNLDFQQAGGMAPDATIIHYNIPDLSDAHIIDGLVQILLDNTADIVSMSFGGPEIFYTAGDNGGTDYTYILKLEDDLFAAGNLEGITFVASSGDSGALSAPPVDCFPAAAGDPYPAHCGMMRASVEFPASSPHVTGVGGTNLVTNSDGVTLDSTYYGEEAYADPLTDDIFYGTAAKGAYWGSGGGVSMVFPRPIFQILAKTGSRTFRTVPDVAGHMGGCPRGVEGRCNPADSFVYEVYHNLYYGAIGTSAAAPDFAGLIALTEQSFGGGRLGNINSYVYTLAFSQSLGVATGVYNQGIPGYNGKFFTKGSGYDRVLGNGTVNGVNFMLSPATPVAGVPQTPTNP